MIGGLAGCGIRLPQAQRRAELVRREVPGAIQGYEVTFLKVLHLLENFAPLDLSQNRMVRRPQFIGRHLIQDGPHLGVTGDLVDLVDAFQITVLGFPPLFEGEQRRVLEGEHGKSRHGGIRDRNFGPTVTRIGDLLKGTSNGPEQGIGAQVLAQPGPTLSALFRLLLSL